MSECPYCTNAFEVNDTCHDEFRMWQGLVGPYYIPTIEDGVLTWTNTGGLPNPNPINIIGAQGNGLYIGGIAETTGDLPETAENGVTWLVGADEPYEGYVYLNGSWVDIGAVTPGPTGPQGIPGAGVPSGGTTGQVLQKASNTDYQTEWADPESGGDPPGTMLPLMDGTAAVGTARSYAREDHRHPQDSEIADLKTSLSAVKSDLGIVEDTDTATHTIAAGQYVIWKSDLYVATAAIPLGTTLSNSNLTAVNNGGLNDLSAVKTTTPKTGVTISQTKNIVSISFIVDLTATTSPSQWVEVCDAPIPAGSPTYSFGAAIDFTDAMLVATRLYNGKLWVDARNGTKNYRGNITYLKD